MQRIVHLSFDRKGHTDATKTAASKLETLPIEQLSGFLLKALGAEKDILKLFDERMPQHEQTLLKDPLVKNFRIVKNHAQIMALVDALALVVPLSEEQRAEARGELLAMAIARQQAINADHPLVQEFWDAFDYLDGDNGEPQLNHSRDEGVIAVNLNHFEQLAQEKKQRVPLLSDLKRVLKTSRARKFIDVKTVNSAINERYNRKRDANWPAKPATLKCWVFKA